MFLMLMSVIFSCQNQMFDLYDDLHEDILPMTIGALKQYSIEDCETVISNVYF